MIFKNLYDSLGTNTLILQLGVAKNLCDLFNNMKFWF